MRKILLYLTIFCFVMITNKLYGQNLYNIDTIRTLYLDFYEANWDSILDSFKLNNIESRVLADLTVDGIKYDSVGVRFKGNSSYDPKRKKNSFNIKIDYIKDQNLYGYITLKIGNMFKDPSCVREVLSYEILRNYMPEPQANYIVLYINGFICGLYTNIESVNKPFLNKHFNSKDNSFFKCDPVTITGTPEPPPSGCLSVEGISSPLIFMGNDTICYEQSYEIKSDYGWTKLMNMILELNNNPNNANNFLDIDRSLWMHVFNNISVNMDSYTGSGHNYYLYENDYDRFNTIVWDLNECFGVFKNGGQGQLSIDKMINLNPLWNYDNDKRPLIEKLMAIPDYKKRYFAHYRTFINEFLANNAMKNRATQLQNMIDTFVANDPNSLYPYPAFQHGLDENFPPPPNTPDIYGINVLMNPRYNYLLTDSNIIKQAPDISDIQQSVSSPSYNDSVWITANISNLTSAFLEYKNETFAPFNSISMYDDGNHNDGIAGDNIFGALIPASNPAATVFYYIYAENNNAGKFSPERAEYECYSYTVNSIQLSENDLVINEIMASNLSTVKDQNNEYDDWIELYNNTNNDIWLVNMFLSDQTDDPYKWSFPDTTIKANDFIIIWADNNMQQGLHSNFKLSKSGETLILSNSDKSGIDNTSFGQQSEDISYGRYPNGTGNFQLMPATFNDYNQTFPDSAISEIYIFPNPANNTLYIKIPDIIETNGLYIEIFNMLSQKVKQYPVPSDKNNISISLKEFTSGIYIIRIGNFNKKIVIDN